jgi:hypothetical protein
MTHEKILQDAIAEYVKNTQAYHDWKDGEFKVTILYNVDKSDPLNQLVVVGAKFSQGEKLYGWRGECYRSSNTSWEKMVEEAIGNLLKDMKENPNRELT